MPLLARETDLFPEDLFDESGWQHTDSRWQVAHTLPRREKDLARRLLKEGVPFFLPQMEQKHRSPGGRARISYLPLFPGYLFLRPAEEQLWEVLDTGCVAKLLPVPDSDELNFDLEQIYRLTRCGTPLVREPQFHPGMRVRVAGGPFLGFEGQILKRQSGERLLVQIHYLQQGVSVSLEGCQIEAL